MVPDPKLYLFFSSFCNNNQQNENDDEHDDDGQTPILLGLSRKAIQSPPRTMELGLMSIDAFLDIIQQHYVAIEFVAYLHAEFALATDARAQAIELVVLVLDDLAVVFMNLLVVEIGLVGRGIGIRIVAVGEEGCAIGIVVVVGAFRGVVAEANGF